MSRHTDYAPIRQRMAAVLDPDQLHVRAAVARLIEDYLAGPPKRTLTALIAATGIDRSSIWRYLTHQSVPDPDKCRILAPVLGLTEDDLLAVAGYRSTPPIVPADAHVPSLTDPVLVAYFRHAGLLPPEALAQIKALMREQYDTLGTGDRPWFAQPVAGQEGGADDRTA